jgi:hypothetical protein
MHHSTSPHARIRRAPLSGALLSLALVAVCPAVLANEIEPGLWEFRTKMQSPDGSSPIAAQMAQMQEQLKNLPPEVRQMMEKQMAGAGLNVGLGADAMSLKLCITPEDAKAGPVREGQREGECVYSRVQQKGNIWSGWVTCTEPQMQGDFTTTLHSASHHTTEARMQGKSIGTMTMQTESKRLGDDCGTLSRRGR